MGSNIKTIPLGTLCKKVLTGGTPLTKNKEFYENGTIPWLKTKEVKFNFITTTENYISTKGLEGSSAKLVPVNSVIVAMYGQGDTAGRVAINKIPVTTNQACCNLVIDPEKADYRFIYYYLKDSYAELVRRKTGSAQPNLNTGILKDFEVPDVQLNIQQQVGGLLESFDNKINLNRQTNQTLEQMAQTLFKSWFVDFDPVFDNLLANVDFKLENLASDFPVELLKKAQKRLHALQDRALAQSCDLHALLAESQNNTHCHFPSEFKFSEQLGWIPKGWEVGCLEDMLVLQRGFDLPKPKRNSGPFPLIVASGQDGTHSESKVKGPGVVTGRSGKIGVITFVHDDFWPLNTTLWIKEYKNSNPYHAYQLLSTLGLEQYNSGSAVPTLNRNHIHNLPLSVPPTSVLNEYTKNVEKLFSKLRENTVQENTLIHLRDTLLPKLISGELQIPDVKAAIEETV